MTSEERAAAVFADEFLGVVSERWLPRVTAAIAAAVREAVAAERARIVALARKYAQDATESREAQRAVEDVANVIEEGQS